MRPKGEYVIPFKGLNNGVHHFAFSVDSGFFALFEPSEIEHGHCTVSVTLEKQTGTMELAIHLEGNVEVTCDYCLELFDYPLQFSESLYVKFGEETDKPSDEMIILSEEEHELDLSHNIYESIILNLPYRRIHPTDNKGMSLCNPDMIRQLKDYSVKNGTDTQTDPRWDQLKNLVIEN